MILARHEYFSPDSQKSLVDRPLRIAQIAPLYESVPPKLYGGTERVVAYIVEDEVAQRLPRAVMAEHVACCASWLRG